LPEHAPAEYSDRSALWNAVEKSERYCTAQLSREIEISLPAKFTHEQNISLMRRFIKEVFVNAGMCADFCFHDKDDGNPHAHVMFTMRPIEPDGKWGQKSRTVDGRKINTVDWNDRDKAEEWRAAWAAYCNAALRENGFDDAIDHRSYARQGKEQIPTVHMGAAATQMERRGIRTVRGDMNREIAITNNEIRQLRARIAKLDKWIAGESKNTEPPTLYDVIVDILNKRGRYGLNDASQMLIFLQHNNIQDLADLDKKVDSMSSQVRAMGKKLNDTERRIKALDEHLMHSSNYKEYRKIKVRYEKLYAEYKTAKKETGLFAERKAKKALETANEYYNDHRAEIAMFDKAEEYLRGVLQGRYDPKKSPPVAMWQNERAAKTAEKKALYTEYYALKDETQKVEQIRRSVADILHSESPERTSRKSRGTEL
jgi:predicted  nucleic acid-binding Zn-ribbon protein